MPDYSKMKQGDFDRILCEIIGDLSAASIIQIPGVYEEVAEYFNNEILDQWWMEQPEYLDDDDANAEKEVA